MPPLVPVVSTKYDGTLRDSCEAELLENAGGLVRLSVPAGTPVMSGKRGQWIESDDDVMEMYFENRWYNGSHVTASPLNLWYCNISMTATFDGLTLRRVDLDIDIRRHPDGSLVVLDEDEFGVNRAGLKYPDAVVERALPARDEALRRGGQGLFPFDHEEQMRGWS